MVTLVEELLYRTFGDFKFDHIDCVRRFTDIDDRLKDDSYDVKGFGMDYLLWLLYGTASDTNDIKLEGIPIFIAVNDQFTLRREDSQSILTGPLLDDYVECRKAIMTGKVVQDATIHMQYGEGEWSVRLKTDTFDYSPFICPQISIGVDDSTYDEGPILERIYLIRKCNELIDTSIKQFIKIYFDSNMYGAYRKDLMKWINR